MRIQSFIVVAHFEFVQPSITQLQLIFRRYRVHSIISVEKQKWFYFYHSIGNENVLSIHFLHPIHKILLHLGKFKLATAIFFTPPFFKILETVEVRGVFRN